MNKEGNLQKIELPFYKRIISNLPSDLLLNMNTQTETEQFYCEPSCECNTRMDIRGRCNPTNDPLTWENCPAKIHSTLFYIEHNYEEYKQYERYCEPGVRQDRNEIISKIAEEKYGLEGSEVDDLLELVNEADEDEYKYNCICCDTFVHTSEEDDCRVDGDEEGLVCWDCIPEHFCEDCDEFYAGIIEPNICGKYICDTCEESRLDAFKEAQQEKADKKEKINKAIIARWNLLKEDMEGWVNEFITFAPEEKRFTDDIVRREGLIKSLNVMLEEIGLTVCDDYSE